MLEAAPTPERARRLSRAKIAAALRRGGGRLNVDARAEKIQAAFRAPALDQPATVAAACGQGVASLVKVIAATAAQIAELEASLTDHFAQHPDAAILRSLPGLGVVTAPGCSPSSVMTPTATRTPRAVETTPAPVP